MNRMSVYARCLLAAFIPVFFSSSPSLADPLPEQVLVTLMDQYRVIDAYAAYLTGIPGGNDDDYDIAESYTPGLFDEMVSASVSPPAPDFAAADARQMSSFETLADDTDFFDVFMEVNSAGAGGITVGEVAANAQSLARFIFEVAFAPEVDPGAETPFRLDLSILADHSIAHNSSDAFIYLYDEGFNYFVNQNYYIAPDEQIDDEFTVEGTLPAGVYTLEVHLQTRFSEIQQGESGSTAGLLFVQLSIPEPASSALLGLSGLLTIARRRSTPLPLRERVG